MAPARPLLAALVAALIGAGTAGAAFAQSRSAADRVPARVQVEGVDVEQVERLAPGVPLNFSVYGTPGAAAMLRIEGVRSSVDLQETQPGIYEGTYVIGPQDRVRPDSRVTATLLRGDVAAQQMLEESLQLGHGTVPLAGNAPLPSEPRMAAPPARADAVRSGCDSCGIVESIQAVPGTGGPGNLGAVSGAVIGAVLGEGAREMHMRRIARIHGALTGAVTGRSAERDAGTRYEVRFRMPDGQVQQRSYPEAPVFQVGDRVSLESPNAAHLAPIPIRP
ncbi:MAG TPA: hypothetical protein VHM00_03135 [Caldimonas sp.]|jgi:outer membrane lipoprotein SlyB|nr:hypothetical protein [Caldimonas sp.]HEX2540058.1 hypothetical protein [Caldimonas sp.]